MLKHRFSIFVSLLLLLLLAGSQCPPPAATPQPTVALQPTAVSTAEPAPATTVLELVGLDGTTKSFTLDELKALPAYENWGGLMTSTGRITPPVRITGVPLDDLAQLVGGLAPNVGVRVVAEDGYAMTYSYNQIANGEFITYDPGTGKEIESTAKLRVVIAYEREGQPNDPKEDGILRVVLLSDDKMQVTDGHWWVKWVVKVELKSLAEDWTFELEGARMEKMDRASFESCAAPGCHGVTWKDGKAQTWSGVPLWLLAARVDDDVEHGDDAYDRALADTGYQVDVIAADGYTASFDGKQIKDSNDFIVAYLVNDNPLDDKDFPLRMVGDGAQKKLAVGQIARIVVHLDKTPAPTAAPEPTKAAPAPAGDAALTISGAVEQPTAWTLAELEAMKVEEITVERPKKGQQTYTGVRLNALLDLVKPQASAASLVFTASDGYTAKVALPDVRNCADCLVAFDDGKLSMVMPGSESSAWVKDVIQIEIK